MSDERVARHQLRLHILSERKKLSLTDRQDMGQRIIETLAILPIFTEHQIVLIYCNYQSEVATLPLLHRCLAEGKTVCVPLAVPQDSRLLAVAITDPLLDLAPGYKGIPEPVSSLRESKVLSPECLDVVIVPGAVFDRVGNRLGYGGGYYDRFLAQAAPQAVRIGLAYSGQLVDRIPALSHDVPMDVLITEKEVLTWKRSGDAKNSGL